MALPSFSKAGMPTLTFSRGNVFPSEEPAYTPVQDIGRSYAGTRRVATLREEEQSFALIFDRLPTADYAALIAWLRDADINWSASSFIFTNRAGVSTTVWYAGGPLSFPEVAGGGVHSGQIPLIREIA